MVIYVGGPNVALIESMRGRQPQIVVGGRCFVIPGLQELDRLSLHLRTLIVRSDNVLTLNRVAMQVVACCQVKFPAWVPDGQGRSTVDTVALRLAAQHFIGQPDSKINNTIHQSMMGNQREIIAKLTAEELYRNRDKFVAEVRAVAAADLARMGVAMVSYTVRSVSDEEGYMEAWGRTSVASVKRAATQATAEFEGAADASVAEREASANEVQEAQRERVMRSNGDRRMFFEDAKAEVNEAESVTHRAYSIESANQQRRVLHARQHAIAAGQRAGIAAERTLVQRERLRFEATRHVQSDGELYLRRAEAQADMIVAQAEAEQIRVVAQAEADRRDDMAEVETEFLERRIVILNKCKNDAFFTAEVLDRLPEIVRAQNVVPASTTMTFVSRDNPQSIEENGDSIERGRAPDVDAEVDITDNLRRVSTANHTRVAASVLTIGALRRWFWPACFGRAGG